MRSVPLFSQEAVELLTESLQVVAKSTTQGTSSQDVPTGQYLYDSSEEEEQNDSEHSTDSSFSSEEENAQAGSDKPVVPIHDATRTAAPTPKPKSAPNPHQGDRRHMQLVNQYVTNLIQTSLPLLDANKILQVPSSLLERSERREHNQSLQCASLLTLSQQLHNENRPVIVLLLRSGRFVAACFQKAVCVDHRSLQRYTVRKGQGKAQSTQDASRRPKSMGAQLRRAGEQALNEDIRQLLVDWKEPIQTAALLLVSCPKTMQKTLFVDTVLLSKDNARIRKVPMDVGRPTLQAAWMVHQVMMTLQVVANVPRSVTPTTTTSAEADTIPATERLLPAQANQTQDIASQQQQQQETIEPIPLTPLHEAARDANVPRLTELLASSSIGIDQAAGPEFMTPLHFAAESTEQGGDPLDADTCVSMLLLEGHADPCVVDARLRPPYFLATHDKVREAFRRARASLGEDAWDWGASKVGPPLNEEDLVAKREKEAEKKRKKKARQKEKKAQEKAEAEASAKEAQREQEQKIQEENARRVRQGLQPATVANAANVCDFCQIECKGRKRETVYKRLELKYCSSECVQKHKRELAANAAMKRSGA